MPVSHVMLSGATKSARWASTGSPRSTGRLSKRLPIAYQNCGSSNGLNPELVMCRATDVPALVTQGVVDAGLTGYDVAVENALATGVVLDMRSLAPARTSFVCLLSPPERFDISVIYTEYPHITRAWARTSSRYGDIEIVPTRGSTEGVIQVDERAAGVALVTSGRTAQANNLEVRAPILATDLCLVTADRARSIGTGLSLDALPRLSMPRLCDGAA